MKIRLKFSKTGTLQYIGHLDVMRTFQKIHRRAGFDIAYSKGFSPHQLMSFATPLGVGLTSTAEYVDVEFETLSARGKDGTFRPLSGADELIALFNAHSTPELQLSDARILPDDAKNAMSRLAAADYLVSFREGTAPADIDAWFERFFAFYADESIVTEKKTKTGRLEVDLKKQIRLLERRGDAVFMRLDTGSLSNLKPELVMETFYRQEGPENARLLFDIERTELYGEDEGVLKALADDGRRF